MNPNAELEDYTLATRKLVMYPDLNSAGRLFGGQLMSWIDEATAMVAMEIMGTRNIVTKKFGEIVFDAPGRLGDIVEVWCRSAARGHTSLTMDCRCVVRDVASSSVRRISTSSVVYVAIDENGRPRRWQSPAP